ncbi:hypothetical protein BKA93DRAFT_751636 [Sparassis latifolia]
MVPDLTEEKKRVPQGGIALSDGYALLCCGLLKQSPTMQEVEAICAYMVQSGILSATKASKWNPVVTKWACLSLQSSLIIRSIWGEEDKTLETLVLNVLYTLLKCMLSLYSEPDATILQSSYNKVWLCCYQGAAALKVVDMRDIISVVGMVPEPVYVHLGGTAEISDHYFVVEKIGLQVSYLAGELKGIEDV